MFGRAISRRALLRGGVAGVSAVAVSPVTANVPNGDPDRRAAAIVARMTLEEQIRLVNGGVGFANKLVNAPKPVGALNTSGFVAGVPRLGIPDLHQTDGGQGVANRGEKRPGDEATQLPAGLALAATFDLDLVRSMGRILGAESRAKGFNVVLGGVAQIVREPRGGRNFESAGEDPLLCGRMAGAMVSGTQSQGVVSTVKHFAVNVQETGRSVHNAVIDEDALAESDLLSFRFAISEGHPGSLMAAYNRINGEWSTQSSILRRVVREQWGFKGWIMSDWGATHSAEEAALAGLDQECGREFDQKPWFGEPLKDAVIAGRVPQARLAQMNHRIVRSLIETGVYDDPPKPGGTIDWERHASLAQRAAERGIVLLKNERRLLPITSDRKKILIVGGHADKGVPTGGGSAQVIPKGGVAYQDLRGYDAVSRATELIYAKSPPLDALRQELPASDIHYIDGDDLEDVARRARLHDLVIVFAVKPSAESVDHPDLSLPDGQDELIRRAALANPSTVVVLETGNAVAMPWEALVPAIVSAWYPGQRGGPALAAILSGRVSPSGRTPISFPRSVEDLPRPALPGWRADVGVDLAVGRRPEPFDIHYHEGSDVGYRWHQSTGRAPLFPFGRGLTYAAFDYANLAVSVRRDGMLHIAFDLQNIGIVTATEVPQVYVAPARRTHRLGGWARETLRAGETRRVEVSVEPLILASSVRGRWVLPAEPVAIAVGPEAGLHLLRTTVSVRGVRVPGAARD